MSEECQNAAQQLLIAGYYRSSISRSYYAAYCGITHLLANHITFSHLGNNPSHTDLPNMILHNLKSPRESDRWEARKSFIILWKMRINADYVPNAYIDRNIALQAFRESKKFISLIGADDDG